MKHDNEHVKNIARCNRKLENLNDSFAVELSRILAPYMKTTLPYSKYGKEKKKELEKKIQKLLDKYSSYRERIILSYMKESIRISEEKNDLLVEASLAGLSAAKMSNFLTKKKKKAGDVVDVYRMMVADKYNGLTLSERVWNLSKYDKATIEHYLKTGFAQGRSALELSKDLKKFLKEPDQLFRRIRNDDGKLVNSKAAKDFNPGQGVYRSSHRNAMRLASTEINRAYRLNDHERWQANDQIVGYKISLSGRHPREDMCNPLAGNYPKTFVFTGWHPNCFCYATPILLKDDDFWDYIDSNLNDKPFDPKKAKNYVTEMPEGFNQFVKDNGEKYSKAKSTPYWIRDNFKNGDIKKGINLKSKS